MLSFAVKEKIEKATRGKSWNLSLARCKLTDAEAAEIDWSALEFVGALDLSGNELTRVPEGVMRLTNLQELSLYKNAKLESLPVGMMRSMRSLTTLLVSDTRLHMLPADFGRAASLRVLDLSSCRFSLIPRELGMCKRLEQLTMDANPLPSVEMQHVKQRTVLEFVRSLPLVGSFGLGGLLEGSASSDLTVWLHTKDAGLVEKELHSCIVWREPWFRHVAHGATLGDGSFSLAVWNDVLQFVYTGAVNVAPAVFDELKEFVAKHPFACLTELVRREVEEQAAERAAVPPEQQAAPLPQRSALLHDAEALGLHLQSLFQGAVSCPKPDFRIVGNDGEIVETYLPVLEARLEHIRIMLHFEYIETRSRTVRVDFDGSVVRSIVEWVFTDAFGIEYEADLMGMLDAATFLGTKELLYDVQDMLLDNMNAQNALFFLEVSEGNKGELALLFQNVVSYVKTNWCNMVELPAFKTLPAQLKDICCR